ncbi:hypothetical protein MGYG_01333 [Nannizzia gypsea CBS 118893]|uniref:Uncharacterized protein n=1 Tax=Arthroderma gypseum (strain ATCC MYA-4604 / CBS 118893) TaxID=535722 RepID=E5R0A4_ARTGP|nr:hypothetical protein MGYG_01333 [Nannizzia gypsea CBS 118893]EFQ98300.1 hypothetical protein MGYG_01333 [Nannizzia gypsea CBS 118893]
MSLFFSCFPAQQVLQGCLPTRWRQKGSWGVEPSYSCCPVNKTCTKEQRKLANLDAPRLEQGHAAVNELAAHSPQRSEACTSRARRNRGAFSPFGAGQRYKDGRDAVLRKKGKEKKKKK